ncbi:hypothetical protein SHA02_21690 [Salisediminibacterium halotolerans]|nr:hypothetical protein SHA02_21690 [Salisediminibacterium halotolerans]
MRIVSASITSIPLTALFYSKEKQMIFVLIFHEDLLQDNLICKIFLDCVVQEVNNVYKHKGGELHGKIGNGKRNYDRRSGQNELKPAA